MKRLVYILFSCFYLLIISNISINLHFCCGNIVAIGFADFDKETDCECGKTAQNNCCNELTIISSLDTDNNIPKVCSFNFQEALLSKCSQLFNNNDAVYPSSLNTKKYTILPSRILEQLSCVFLRI